jgi:mono/diheme cytochrome c family protein
VRHASAPTAEGNAARLLDDYESSTAAGESSLLPKTWRHWPDFDAKIAAFPLQKIRVAGEPMIRRLIVGAGFAAILVAGIFWILTIPAAPPAALPPHKPDLANGREMFFAGGCASCHAVPKQQDTTRLGGGLALGSPFGTFYVPNISPDRQDGIGGWSEIQFVAAMTQGVSPAGEHLFPAFPYTSYRNMRPGDLRDLFAFLKTLPPVAGRAREHDLRFPFNIRRAVGIWKLLFLNAETFVPDPSRSAQWNRGAYLVNGPGHCAECHSPRNAFGAVIARLRFTGGPSPDGHGGVPNITQYKLKSWTEQDIAETLNDGMTPDAGLVGGRMIEVVFNMAKLTAADRMAIAAYIKSLPAVEGRNAPPKKPE